MIGIAQMMRVGLFKPVHMKTASQQRRLLLTLRKLLQRNVYDPESDLRSQLRNFGLKVGTLGLADGQCVSPLKRRAVGRPAYRRCPPADNGSLSRRVKPS